MLIAIHDDALRGLDLTEDQARLDLALGLFIDQRVTLGRGAEIARLPQADFLKELGQRGIPVHYDVEDFHADLRTLGLLESK
jgi:predicted HTH domain antitoxin